MCRPLFSLLLWRERTLLRCPICYLYLPLCSQSPPFLSSFALKLSLLISPEVAQSQMERNSAAVHSQTTPSLFGSSFADHLKRSPSQLEFQECLEKIAAENQNLGEFRTDRSITETDGFFGYVCSGDLSFAFKNRVSHFPSVHLLLSSLTCPTTLLCHMSASVSLQWRGSLWLYMIEYFMSSWIEKERCLIMFCLTN